MPNKIKTMIIIPGIAYGKKLQSNFERTKVGRIYSTKRINIPNASAISTVSLCPATEPSLYNSRHVSIALKLKSTTWSTPAARLKAVNGSITICYRKAVVSSMRPDMTN